MSDLRRIIADKQATRGQATPEQRQLKALEEISDSLEGIRQDVTALSTALADISRELAKGKF
jgi:ABC-type transporter Mla subunit MlaD